MKRIFCLFRQIPLPKRSLTAGQLCTQQKPKQFYLAELKEKQDMYREVLKNELTLSKNFTSEQWDEFAAKLINRDLVIIGSYVNARNVDGVILRYCAEFELNEVGRAYFEHMKKKNNNLSDSVLSRYLTLCAHDKKYMLDHEEEIIAIYKQLRKSQVMEPHIAERCISAICLFEKHWKESLFLLEEIKQVIHPSPFSYCVIIEACFNFGEVQLGWDMMRTLAMISHVKPRPGCYVAYIDHCQRLVQSGKFSIEDLEKLFMFLEEFHLKLTSTEVVTSLEKLIFSLSDEKNVWSLKETYIPKNAACSNCRRVLEPVRISSSEFNDLCRHFVKKAVIGSNVFLRSTPEEIERFKIFLTKSHPYDIVIDGLNVAYSRGMRGPSVYANSLKEVVAHFVRKNQKVLVLGRRHMKEWPNAPMQYIYKNAKVFLATNLSQDDPLLLYAALKGGEKTSFISRDFMRSHLFALEDPQMKLLFRKWLISHQYIVGYFNKQGIPNINAPLSYRPTAQKLPLKEPELCWHVPYDEAYQVLEPEEREPPPRWVCIQRRPRKN